MAHSTITISFLESHGTKGSLDGQFNYPSGISFSPRNNKFYVADRQNQRVQIFDSNFDFDSGAIGFNFPEGIVADQFTDFLFLANSANHSISKINLIGAQTLNFGSRGSGNSQFNYPVDVELKYPYLYVCDKLNNRIVVYNYTTGTPQYNFTINSFNFPEAVKLFNNKIVVADSGNKEIKFFDTTGGYLFSITNDDFVYPTGLLNIDDNILMVIDKQGSKLYFYNFEGVLLYEFSDGLFYPEDAAYVDGKIYITDSANHRVSVYQANIIDDIPYSYSDVLKLTRQLYPTGRAWWMKVGGVFSNLHEGLGLSESRAYQSNIDLQNAIIPDNDNFTETDAFNHEQAFGLVSNDALDLEVRKQAILRKMQYPGNVPARQDKLYIQQQLQTAGFDVYVHENRDQVTPAIYGLPLYGQLTYGSVGILPNYSILANYVNETRDENFNIGSDDRKNFLFFVGGAVKGDFANVPLNRKNEFRELILKLKPATMAGLLHINYV